MNQQTHPLSAGPHEADSYTEKTSYALYLPRPYLARHPWVGFFLFGLSLVIFTLLAWQVKTNPALNQWDLSLAQRIYAWAKQQPQSVVLFMRFWSFFGRDGEALIAVILAVVWMRKHARRELYMLFFGMLAGEVWYQFLGEVVKRQRPEFKDPFEKLIGYGFPSGHATTTVLLVMLLLLLILPHIRSVGKRAALVIVSLAIAAIICYSRLFLGLHYFTDIMAGVVLGLGWGSLVYTLIDLYFWRTTAVSSKTQTVKPAKDG